MTKRLQRAGMTLAAAKAKALERALAKAKQFQCGTRYKLVKGKYVRA